jgi:hypothetical protein
VTECLPAGWKHGSFAGATPKRCRARDRILNGGTSECHRFYAEYTSLICQTFDVVQQRISCRRSEVPSRPTSRIGRTRQSSDRLCFALLRGCGQQLLDQSLLCMRREFPLARFRSFLTELGQFTKPTQFISVRASSPWDGGAFVYAYVLSGTLRSRLDDEPIRNYRRGEGWFEFRAPITSLTKNASATESARLLVVFICSTGDSLKTDDRPNESSSRPEAATHCPWSRPC